MMRVSIVGPGRLGGSFAIALSRAGIRVSEFLLRSDRDLSPLVAHLEQTPEIRTIERVERIDADLLLVAVPDPAIADVAMSLRGKLADGTVVVHTSGALSSEVLAPLAADGFATGSLHPLVSFSDPVLGAERLRGSFFCLEGESRAVASAAQVVEALGGHSFTVEASKKPLYHASAVMACGHVVALLDVAFEMLSDCGMSRDQAQKVLMPLTKGTLMNLEEQSPADALTGPFARGDVSNFEQNIEAIERSSSPIARALYLELGERSLELAEKQGADPERIALLREKLRLAK